MEALLKTTEEAGLTYVDDAPVPELGPADVLVEIATTAICGTDVHLYRWDAAARNFPLSLPRVIGHEAAGTVAATGEAVRGVRVGDRVAFETHIPCGRCYACRTGNAHNCEHVVLFGIDHDGAFARYAAAPESVLFRLPDGMTFETGALLEPAGVAMHAIQRSEMRPGDTVAVVGCGPIGLMSARLAQLAGASRVVCFDVNPRRTSAARDLGAIGLDPTSASAMDEVARLAATRGGVDVLIEASGAAEAYGWALGIVRREGTVVTVGHPGGLVPIDITGDVNKRGLTVRGVFGRRMWSTWTALAALLESGRLDLAPFITHRYALRDFEQGFAALADGAIKVLLTPDPA